MMNGTETDTPDTVARRLRSTPANGGTEKVSRKRDEQFMTITESAVVQRIRRKLRNTGNQGRRSGKTVFVAFVFLAVVFAYAHTVPASEVLDCIFNGGETYSSYCNAVLGFVKS